MVAIGEMYQRLEWQSGSTVSVNGEPQPSYVSNGTFWASVKPTAGDEKAVNKNQELRSEVTHIVRMRYVTNAAGNSIVPQDRLIFKGKTLQVLFVNNVDEVDIELIITCKEVRVQVTS